jgi:hypothetical protein
MYPKQIFLVELFSGSRSVSQAFESNLPRGSKLHAYSVDIHPKYNPTTATDILTWDYQEALKTFLSPAKEKCMIWVHASPPCTEYSKAKTTAPRNLDLADALAKRALRILRFCEKISPRGSSFYWTIENPVGLMRTRGYMQKLERQRHTTSYCKWGKPFRKDTDIWTNVPDLVLPICRQGSYCPQKASLGHHPTTAQSGPSSNASGSGSGENVYPLPSDMTAHIFHTALVDHIFRALDSRTHS